MRTFSILLIVLVAGISARVAYSQSADAQSKLEKADRLFFIENKGQWHSDVLYLCRMGGLDAWITKYGMNYTFYKIEKNRSLSSAAYRNDHDGLLNDQQPKSKFDHEDLENTTLLGHRVLLELQNRNSSPAREGKKQMEGYYNYFIGNDPSKHATYVGLYKEAIIKNVYSGIDLRYYFDKGNLRYDFVVQPYADPSQIQFKLRGQDKVYTKGESKLCFTTRFGEVELADLKTYQENKVVQSKFVKQGEVWTFALGNYDRSKPLIIDPLVYSTYIGGTSLDEAYDIAVDGSGNACVTGYTLSANYDITAGAFQTTYGGGWEAFVTKLNATGTGLVYSTYIGGNDADWGHGIAVDGSGSAYITGYAGSTYIVTAGVFQTTHEGGGDAFVTKLNTTGTALVYSTYLGGSSSDWGTDITVDGSGNVYVTGHTYSNNYDVTAGAFQTTYGGGSYDVFVTKLNATGTALVYSTYLGGSSGDWGYGIAVDGSGQAYVTGVTQSTDYDITAGAFQTTYGGGDDDVFVTKLNATGTALVYSTYLGGSGSDEGKGITVDGSGSVYITGYTNSTDYDVTSGAFQTTTHGGGFDDIFVTKLNAMGTGLVYSTYLGGSGTDWGHGIVVDGSGQAYVTGSTFSTDYDITAGAFQTTNDGGADVFVTKLNATGSSLVYSTYIGGSGVDDCRGIVIDGMGQVYVMGYTGSTDYDITGGAFQTTNGGLNDVFVTKLDLSTTTSMDNTTIPQTQTFTLYPNPAQNSVVIENFTATAQEYELTDISGKILQIYTLPQGKNSIPINLPKGMYFVRERKHGYTQKLLVE